MKESFSELYTRLYKENFNELEALREKAKTSSIKIISMIIVGIVLTMINPALTVIYIIIVAINSKRKGNSNFEVKKEPKSYKAVFKEKIVGPIIEHVFENSKYNPKAGLSRWDYEKAKYGDDIDRYSSDDLVIAPLNVNQEISTFITFAEVHTEKESRDEDGHTTYSTVFHGLAGSFMIPKNLEKSIYIRSNWKVTNWNKNKVKMDMPEFEKIFDVESDDKILTMRILTADVMAEMIDLYKKYKYKFEISIIEDTVYMRLATGAVFDPDVFKSSMEYKQIEKYYLVLKALTSIAEHIYDTILKLEE